MNETRLNQLLNHFPKARVLVVGDYFLDKYLELDRHLSETSLETGLEAYQATALRSSPGAAGTVVNNLRALEVQVSALGVIGDDGHGYELRAGLLARGVDVQPILVHPGRLTPTYIKPMMHEPDGRVHELNRVDVQNRAPLPESAERQVIERLRGLAASMDGIVVADQVPEADCGVVTARVRRALADLARAHPGLVIVADSRRRIGLFDRIILKPNAREAVAAVEGDERDEYTRAEVEAAGRALFRRTGQPVFVTVGAGGVLVFTQAGMQHVPGVPVAGPLDIVGAGDSVMAGIAASLCSGAAPGEAALVGNLVASITVQQIGTTGTATRAQVLKRFREPTLPRQPDGKAQNRS